MLFKRKRADSAGADDTTLTDPAVSAQNAGEGDAEGSPFTEDAPDKASESVPVRRTAFSEDAMLAARADGVSPATHEERQQQIEASKKKRRRKKIVRRIMWAFAALIFAALIALCVAFALFRWNTFDDAADMQGTWRLVGTDMPVEISDQTIRLNEEVAYKYWIDPESKTITFRFGNMEGKGRYRFSLDRQQLSITDGQFDFWGTLFDDASWTIAALLDEWLHSAQLSPGQGVGVTALTRQLDPAADAQTAPDDGALDALAPEAGDAATHQDGEDGTAGDGSTGEGDATAGAEEDPGDTSSSQAVRDVDALDVPGDVAHVG